MTLVNAAQTRWDGVGPGWSGYWVALPTPFASDGEIDLAVYGRLVDQYIGGGVDGLVVNGSTGEWASQSPIERARLAEMAVTAAAGRVPVVVGCSSLTIDETTRLATEAIGLGADGCMATVPPYAHPTEPEAMTFFTQLTERASGPWVVYNWPRGVGLNLRPDTVCALATLPGVIAVKDSRRDRAATLEVFVGIDHDVTLFFNCIDQALTAAAGERQIGFVDGGAIGIASAVAFFAAARRGDVTEAARHGADFTRLSRALVNPDYTGRFGSQIAQIKASMALLGDDIGGPRSPYLQITDEATLAELETVLLAHLVPGR